LAGASIDPKVYYNHRFELDPPESLLKEIFPFVEETISHFKAQIARKEISTELSGMGFLNLLKHLRTVILQDAAILMEDPSFKNHSIFNHQLFLTKEFEEFAIKLRTKIITDPDPEQILIQRALPHIGTSLTRIDSNLVGASKYQETLIESQEKMMSLLSNIRQGISIGFEKSSLDITQMIQSLPLNDMRKLEEFQLGITNRIFSQIGALASVPSSPGLENSFSAGSFPENLSNPTEKAPVIFESVESVSSTTNPDSVLCTSGGSSSNFSIADINRTESCSEFLAALKQMHSLKDLFTAYET
jgi:hypothetical protein